MAGKKRILTDNSRLVIESLVASGCDVFVGYPITPANLLYGYAAQRCPVVEEAPDEISALQWMAGYSSAGHLPVTATSFPGLALMIESLNMAYMMELPMVAVIVQRMGPSTGTATAGAQGDLMLLAGMISGGYPVPVFCLSDSTDCWEIPNGAVRAALEMRTPVIILTSKEMMMGLHDFDTGCLKPVKPVKRKFYDSREPYIPYKAARNHVPGFLPAGNPVHRVRITASTHDEDGMLQHSTPEALANSARLQKKIMRNMQRYLLYELDEEDCGTLIVSYGITAESAREAVSILRSKGKKISLLVCKTMIPVPGKYLEIIDGYRNVIIAEENLSGQFRTMLFGRRGRKGVAGVNAVGKMISPENIAKAAACK